MNEMYSWQVAYRAAILETDNAAIPLKLYEARHWPLLSKDGLATLSLTATRTEHLKTRSEGYWPLRLSE